MPELAHASAVGREAGRDQLSSNSADQAVKPAEFQRFHVPDEFRRDVGSLLSPGATIIVTADSLRNAAVAQPLTVIETESKGL